MGTTKKQTNHDMEEIIKNVAKETVRELKKAKLIKEEVSSYFQKTEKLLYNYRGLLKALEQKNKDIEYIETHGLSEGKSKSIVLFSRSTGISPEEQYIDILEGYKASKARTERLIQKIQKALENVQEDYYYYIIEAKYFDKLTNAEIEEKFAISDSSIKRHRKRLIEEIQTIIFGVDALELSDNLSDI